MHSSVTFVNVVNIAVERAAAITSYNTTFLKASWNIFSLPSMNAYASFISTLSFPMNSIIANFYTLLYNSSRTCIDQLITIDTSFIA
jgi:hypothetical protein